MRHTRGINARSVGSQRPRVRHHAHYGEIEFCEARVIFEGWGGGDQNRAEEKIWLTGARNDKVPSEVRKNRLETVLSGPRVHANPFCCRFPPSSSFLSLPLFLIKREFKGRDKKLEEKREEKSENGRGN